MCARVCVSVCVCACVMFVCVCVCPYVHTYMCVLYATLLGLPHTSAISCTYVLHTTSAKETDRKPSLVVVCTFVHEPVHSTMLCTSM